MKKIRIAVLMGGKSPEHEISILSGQQVIAQLNEKKYKTLPIVISKSGKWQLTTKNHVLELSNLLKTKGTNKDISLVSKREIDLSRTSKSQKIDLFFVAMHGPFGEDGTVQGMLDLSGVPYTGSGVLASALGMDKIVFRKIMKVEKISTPKYFEVRKDQKRYKLTNIGGFPFFVKPHNQGSSVGVTIATNPKQLKKSLNIAHKYSAVAIVDEYIKGREFTCSVIGNRSPIALPVIEIIPKKGDFFNYESKYTESGAEEIVPAKISNMISSQIKDLAIKVYQATGCRGFGRVDFLMNNNGKIYVLEINTIPGLTPMSLLPKSAKAFGLSYSQLLDRIVSYALKK